MTYRALRHALFMAVFAGGFALAADATAQVQAENAPAQGTTAHENDDDGMDYGLAGLLGLLGLLGLRRRDHHHVNEVRVDPRATTSSTRP